MSKTLFGGTVISYGANFPPTLGASDGMLFFKTSNPGAGLYIFSLSQDTQPGTPGDQTGQAWNLLVSTSASGLYASLPLANEFSGVQDIGGFGGYGGVRISPSSNGFPGAIAFTFSDGNFNTFISASGTGGSFGGPWNFSSDTPTVQGNTVWHAGNDGSGSLLDAGRFAGQLPTYYLNMGNTALIGTLATDHGGTGSSIAALTPGGVIYAATATTMAGSGVSSAGSVLISNGAAAPTWVTQGSLNVGSAGTAGTAVTAGTAGTAGTVSMVFHTDADVDRGAGLRPLGNAAAGALNFPTGAVAGVGLEVRRAVAGVSSVGTFQLDTLSSASSLALYFRKVVSVSGIDETWSPWATLVDTNGFPSGTAGAPSITFTSDNTTGLYYTTSTAPSIGLSTEGVTRLLVRDSLVSATGKLSVSPGTVQSTAWTTTGSVVAISSGTTEDTSTLANTTVTTTPRAAFSISQPTFTSTNTGVKVPNAATLYISNQPQGSVNTTIQNSNAIWVNGGSSVFGGPISVGTTTSPDVGPIATYTFTGGSGHTNGLFTNVPFVSTGSGDTLVSTGSQLGYGGFISGTIAGGVVTALSLSWPGTRYAAGDVLIADLPGSGTGFTFTVSTVSAVQINAVSTTGAVLRLSRNDTDAGLSEPYGSIVFSSRDISDRANGDRAFIRASVSPTTLGASQIEFHTSTTNVLPVLIATVSNTGLAVTGNISAIGNITAGTGAFTGTVTAATPTASTHLATKAYVDSTAVGISVQPAVDACTTGNNLNTVYNNGASGVGATITSTVNGAMAAVDGVTLAVNDRLLVRNSWPNTLARGIYIVSSVGSAGTPFVLTRDAAYDGSPSTEIDNGDFVFTNDGTLYKGTQWVQTTASPIIFGTSVLSFEKFSAIPTFTGSNGIEVTGSVISIDNTGSFTTGAITSTSMTTQKVGFAAGSALLPSIYFSPDTSTNTGFFWPADNQIAVTTSGTEVARFTDNTFTLSSSSSGLELTSYIGGTGIVPVLQLQGTSIARSSQLLSRFGNDASGAAVMFAKSRATTITASHSASTEVAAGDVLGQISFAGSDTTQFIEAASIVARVTSGSTTTDGAISGTIEFRTTNNTSAPATRMSIRDDGIIDVASNRITSVATPTASADATTKAYVDAAIAAALDAVVPVGSIKMWPTLTPPAGWIVCNGASLARTGTYADLFAVIGGTFGAPSSSTFSAPDFRGVFPRGLDDMGPGGARGLDSGRVLGTYQEDMIQVHKHIAPYAEASGGRYGNTGAQGVEGSNSTDQDNFLHFTNDGTDEPGHPTITNPAGVIGTETRPKNLAIVFIIKYQ
jgi:microcystin-dependent protein